MAGIKLKMRKELPGSSILEVIISMVVIVVVFSIAMGIFANVQRLSLSGKKIHAQAVLRDALIKIEQSPKQAEKQTNQVDGFTIIQEITTYDNHVDLFKVNLIAYDDNKELIAELNEVVCNEK